MATNSIGEQLNQLCTEQNREPATPYVNFDCALCHDSGPGSPGAGVDAWEANPRNLDFFCKLPAGNTPPMANAGPDQSVAEGDVVTLDGSGSSDGDGDPLTYNWSLASVPSGSAAALSDASAAMPTFTADVAGDYVVELIVNDGTDDSPADSVTITAGPGNTAPVADAGPDQSVKPGDAVTLDGSGSSDVDGDPLTYTWSLTVVPAGSTATLSDPAAVTPTFTADVAGDYVVELVVSDGTASSPADSVTITASDDSTPPGNTPPVANAGADQSVSPGDTVTLDGSASSDADGDDLTYLWSFVSIPPGSTAMLSDLTSATPSFTADLAGDYVAQLIVNDGTADSAPATVTVRADADNTAPVANAGMDQSAQPGDTVMLDGSGSSDPDGDALTYSWSIVSNPAGSTATLSDPTSPTPSFVADMAGDYVWQLTVNDGLVDSVPDTVLVTVQDQPVDLPTVMLRLNVDPSRKGAFRVKAVVEREDAISEGDDTEEEIPVRVDLTVEKPDGTTAVLAQKRAMLDESSTVRARYLPKMDGEHVFHAVVVDDSGNELASQSESVMVTLKGGAHDRDRQEERHHKKRHHKDRHHKERHHKDRHDD